MPAPLGPVRSMATRWLPTTLADSGRPSVTAEWVALGRALERERSAPDRIVNDPFAATFLSRAPRALSAAAGPAAPLLRRGGRLAPVDPLATLLCRHRFIDEALLAGMSGFSQVIVLGAGYDARAYRFAHSLGPRPVIEVDLAPTSRRKAAIVAAHPHEFAANKVVRLELDVRAASLGEQLVATAGFAHGAPTFVAWEGVAMYLPAETVTATLATLAAVCGPGSILAMDCWRPPADSVAGRARRAGEEAIRLVGEPIRFRVTPTRITELLNEAGFDVLDLSDGAEQTRRYATGGRRCDDGLFLLTAQHR